MTRLLDHLAKPSGIRRRAWRWALPLLAIGVLSLTGASSAAAADGQAPATSPLVALLDSHTARVRPDARAERIETVASRRPLTKVRTVLPVLGEAVHGSWLRVRLPGRPNGHTGWIASAHTRTASTEWSIAVDLSARRVAVYQHGTEVRRFPAVVGKPSTPTPRGRFFVEEAMALAPTAPGGPFALATSARSNALQEFDGGPGQIALHGRNHLSGAPGTASSHGCVRLSTAAIAWLARRVGAGTPVVIER
jgi:lipoprotein-anchoring transpeptidase ErfK/SrfK